MYGLQTLQPWPSGYGRRLMFRRLWVRIPALYTGWTFFTFICCKNCNCLLENTKMNEKEAGNCRFLKRLYLSSDVQVSRQSSVVVTAIFLSPAKRVMYLSDPFNCFKSGIYIIQRIIWETLTAPFSFSLKTPKKSVLKRLETAFRWIILKSKNSVAVWKLFVF